MNKNKGFTLLELVVVVAIIGLLASIALVPNLIRFQQRGAAARMKSVAAQIATSFELAGSEGCTNFDITLGGVVDCDVPLPVQIYIQTLPTNPTTGPRFDLDAACDPVGGYQTSLLDQDATTGTLSFCLRGFLAGTGTFTCNRSSCACTVDGECMR